tara:strand:+ start:1326 stop:1937 length:612 start_codon:yes stop_codon:yes gene_type:complete
MSNISYRKKILDAVRLIGSEQRDMLGLTIKNIAKTANVKEKIVLDEFKDINEILFQATVFRFKEHESKANQIARLPGEYSLATLIRHDLIAITLFAQYSKDIKDHEVSKFSLESFKYSQNYFDIVMPTFYYSILIKNPSLMPNKGMSARLYSHFLVHSLFFFTKKELFSLNPDVSETNRIAKQLLNRLLIISDETPKKEIQTA